MCALGPRVALAQIGGDIVLRLPMGWKQSPAAPNAAIFFNTRRRLAESCMINLPSIGLEEALGKRPALAAMMIVPARLGNRA